uniref:Uncharacterized protein n=1 Tax=Panagrolaimus davidi TaxID=227884 RepID=A0A914P383_9BILA
MVKCQFCGEWIHESNECKKYATDKDRKIIADKKKFCRFCFIKSDKIHLPYTKECPTNDKCIGWYSTDHHAVFCPERVKAMAKKLFLPKIDEDLFQRFIETFEIEEQFAFGLSSLKAQKYAALKNIKLSDRFYIGDSNSISLETFLNLHEILAVTQTLYIFDPKNCPRMIASKNITKSVNGVIIKIRYENREKQEEFHRFADKMSKIFIEKRYRDNEEVPYIVLELDGFLDYSGFTLNSFKKHISATKRSFQL